MADKTVSFSVKGGNDFRKANGFLERCLEVAKLGYLDRYGRRGVEALSAATPIDTGLAASSWSYDIERSDGQVRLTWHNSDIENGCNVAVLVQYGHATKSGSWVEGVDFINPALAPIFEQISNDVWKELSSR